MNPDPEELLDELLDFENGVFPREVLTEIIERREEFAEPLLIALNDIREHPMDMTDDDTFFPIYVVYLLAQFREKRAWKPLLEILALPGEIPDQLFGDTITEDMGNILASLYDGDEQGLRDLIENPNVNEYVRAATGLDAYLTLMATGQISLASLETYFGELLESKLERQPSFVWDCLATTCADLGFDNLLPSIEIAFSEGLCDPGFNGLEDIKKTLDSGGCDRWRSNAALIDDTISELSDWACFDSQPKSTKPTAPSSKNRLESLPSFRALQPVRVEPAAGRNEPCPCGSGKKYKKCCGDEATKAAALSAVREKINQSILHVRIDLMNAEFPIWREVLMSGHSTLADLHRVIQRSMPWENSHLHNFRHGTIDSRKANTADTHGLPAFEIQTQLAQFVDSSSPLVYTYDFGDDWEHLITITVWQGELKPAHLPICIAGENAAPPEDSGGVWGYANMLEIVADESHPDYEDMQEWLGEDFDPHHFCLEEINKQLS